MPSVSGTRLALAALFTGAASSCGSSAHAPSSPAIVTTVDLGTSPLATGMAAAPGSTETRPTPRQPVFRGISPGIIEGVCAVFAGDLRCTGDTPDPGPIHHVQSIAVSIFHGCVLRQEGALACYGYNKDGRVGTGTRSDQEPLRLVLPLSNQVVDVALGARSSCALLADGSVYCWGDDASLVPARVDTPMPAREIGSNQAEQRCALLADGSLALGTGAAMVRVGDERGFRSLAGCVQDDAVCGLHGNEPRCVGTSSIAKIARAAELPHGRAFVASDAVGCVLADTGRVTCVPWLSTASAFELPGVAQVEELGLALDRLCVRVPPSTIRCFALGDSATPAEVLR